MTHDELLNLMHYDPETGAFTWREYRYPRKESLSVGALVDGYVKTRISLAHRRGLHAGEGLSDPFDCGRAHLRKENPAEAGLSDVTAGLRSPIRGGRPKTDLNAGATGDMEEYGGETPNVKRKTYPLHRLAWFYVNQVWPEGQIDHINGVRSDNRISNLRVASHSENQTNGQAHKNNKLGIRGVRKTQRGAGYSARITKDGKQINLGYFKTPEEAAEARKRAEVELHGPFRRA